MGINQRESSLVLLGRRIKALREAADISQEQLQYATGISQPQIVSIESGRVNTGLNHISKLASFFGFEDYELLQYKAAIPSSESLRKGIQKYLNSVGIDATLFLKKSVVFYVETKLLQSRFLNTPKTTKEIADFLESRYDAKFTTTTLSQALERFRKKGLIEKIPADSAKRFKYLKKG